MADTLGRQAVIERLLDAERKGRLGHTLLLVGSGGYGTYEVAFRLARTLLCPERTEHASGACKVCDGVDRLSHPDLLVIAPLSPEYRRALTDGKASPPDPLTEALAKDRFAPLEIGANWTVTTDQGREIIAWAARTPWEARGKVVVIAEADRLREDTGDILLKTLEEPPAGMTVILVTGKPHELLPTIRSRCHQVRVPPLSEADAADLLVERGVARDDAQAVARLANGDFWQARTLLGQETNAVRNAALQLIGAALDPKRSTAEVMAEAKRALETAPASGASELVRWMIWWMRDLLFALAGSATTADEVREILPQAEKLGVERLANWLEEADRSYEMLGRNVTKESVLAALVIFPRDERRISAVMTFPPIGISTGGVSVG